MDTEWADLEDNLIAEIKRRLFGSDYLAAHLVCKSWKNAPRFRPKSSYGVRLFSLDSTGKGQILPSLWNESFCYDSNVPNLVKSEILCVKDNWILMSQKHVRTIFFYNIKTEEVVPLPQRIDQIEEKEILSQIWCVSDCPESPDCTIVGCDFAGAPPAIFIIKVGELKWYKHEVFGEFPDPDMKLHIISKCKTAIFRGECVYVLTDAGDLGQITVGFNSAEEPSWRFFLKSFSRAKCKQIKESFISEDIDGESILVCVLMAYDKFELWMYKFGESLQRHRVMSLGEQSLFVSRRFSFLKPIASGLTNKVFLPTIHENKAVVYCLRNNKCLCIDYAVYQIHSSISMCKSKDQLYAVWVDGSEIDREDTAGPEIAGEVTAAPEVPREDTAAPQVAGEVNVGEEIDGQILMQKKFC